MLAEGLTHLRQPALAPPPRVPRPPHRGRAIAWALAAWLLLLGALGLRWAWPDHGPAGPAFEAASGAGTTRIESVRFRTALQHPGLVRGVAFAAQWELVATACDDRIVRLWALKAPRRFRALTGHRERAWSVAFSPDGRMLASAAGNWACPEGSGELKLWDVRTGAEVRSLPGHEALVFCVAFSPDGQALASASWDETVRLWDATTGKLRRVLRGHKAPVRSLAFSPDGRLLASGGFDGTVRLWDARGGQARGVLGSPGNRVNCVAFSPDGLTLASAEIRGDHAPGRGAEREVEEARPGRVRLWAVPEGVERGTLVGHRGAVLTVAFTPDGQGLVSGGGDWDKFGEVIVWDIASQARGLSLSDRKTVEAVVLSPDGRWLFTASGLPGEVGDVRAWELVRRGTPLQHDGGARRPLKGADRPGPLLPRAAPPRRPTPRGPVAGVR